MSHEIEIYEDGTAGFVAARTPGWHQLGTVYAGQDGLTVEQVMTDAKLRGWNVRKIANPTVFDPITGELVTSDDDFMIVRTNPVTGKPDKLGMAGNWFQPIQNEAHADFFNALVDGGAGFDTAGSLYNGRNVFITMKLPASVEIAGVDRVDLYVVVINHHDGHGSFTVLITPIRVVCANTQSMALANNERMIKIRHTESATANVAEAQKALGLSYRFMETFQAEAERMITETLTKGQFEEIIGRVFGEPGPSKMAQTSRRNLTGDLMTLFSEAPTQEIGRGTRWAGLQAITEWADYQMPVRGADDHDVARAARSLLGDADKYKQRAFDLLRVPA